MELDLAKEVIMMLKANNDTSNTHCTIMTHVVTAARADLDCQKCKIHQLVKTGTCYIAHPVIEDKWNATQKEKAQHVKETAKMEV